jgi:vancomycin resistance protein YoaR
MPERQSSPGEAEAPPEPEITENVRGARGTDQAASSDRAEAAAPSPVRSVEPSGGDGRPAGPAARPAPARRPSPGPAAPGKEPAGDESPTVRTQAGGSGTPQPSNGRPANGKASTGQPAKGQPSTGHAPNAESPDGQHGNGRPAPGPNGRGQNARPTNGRPAGGQHTGGEDPTVRVAARPPGEQRPPAGPRPQAEQRSAEETTAIVPAAVPSRPRGDGESTQLFPRSTGRPAAGDDEQVTVRIPAIAAAPRPPMPPPDDPTRVAAPGDFDDTGNRDGDDRTTGDRGPRRGRRRVLVLSAFVGALGLLYGADLLLGMGSVPRGVTVAGVPVGGLALAEADQRLRAEIGPRIAGPIPVAVGDASGEIDPVAAGLSLDWEGTLDEAGDPPLNPIARITSFFTEREVGVVTIAEPTALTQALEQLGPVVDREPVEGAVRFEGTQPQPVEPKPGQQLDVTASADVLQRDWANGGTVALPLSERPPTTTTEDVTAAIQEVARPAVAAPITVVGEDGVRGTIDPEVIAAALSFRAENGRLVPELNQQAVQDAVASQMAPSEWPGRDATFDFSGGSPVVVPSQDGRGVDYQATVAALLEVLAAPAPREVTAVYADQPADVTTEELRAIGNPVVIGEFTTGGFAPDSGRNIQRAAELVNGTVVGPGETFSLDAVTGPRTAANGYVEAGVIDNGRASRGIAGGASQVSTTLYNAAYFAGMTLVEHKAHSFYISRYPAGREATIATGAIDNKFRNDNPTPILIRTRWTPSSVTVQIYGQRHFEVTGEFGPRTNPTQPNTVTISDDEECKPSNGAPGFTITDTRTRRNISTGEVTKETITTRYNPSPRVVCDDD